MRKYVLYCDRCKKEVPGHFVTIRYLCGPLDQKEHDLCKDCAEEYQKWFTEGDVNGEEEKKAENA